MRPHFWLIALAVAGCDSASVTTADVRTSENSSGPARPVEAAPTAAAEARGERVSAFPAVFQGRWAMVAADCKGDAAAKGLMTIDDKTIRFYESRGVTTGLSVKSPTKVAGSFTFDGEGQRWRKDQSFELSGGKTLVRMETDPAQSFTYQRCA